MRYTTKSLQPATWDAFADLVERNGGVFGGCWCMGFHAEDSRTDGAANRANGKHAYIVSRTIEAA